jgi:hypothetical protein
VASGGSADVCFEGPPGEAMPGYIASEFVAAGDRHGGTPITSVSSATGGHGNPIASPVTS